MENDSDLTVIKSDILKKCKNKEIKKMEMINNKSNTQHASHTTSLFSRGITTANNSSSPKMGSRRIFTPQFKLQVLESYRNDSDCKGNQRATARKYNIHRRQIQKWLQCESSLRSSVANINHNSVKHQFHNVSMPQQQTKNTAITSHCSGNSLTHNSNQVHSTHICIDSSRDSIKVPLLPSCVSTSSTQEAHDHILGTNKFTAAAAAAAKETIEISSSWDPTQLQTSISPLLHQNFRITSYSGNTTSTATLPILAHTSTQPHMCQNFLPNQTSYQYHHNMAYSPTISHHLHPTEKQQASYFTPIINLPNFHALSSVASTPTKYAREYNDIEYKLEIDSMATQIYRKFESNSPYYENNDSTCVKNKSSINLPFSLNQFKEDLTYPTSLPFVPIDLSLRHRREIQSTKLSNAKTSFQNTENRHMGTPANKNCNDPKINIVDLTYRKRRMFNNSHEIKSEFSEKKPKCSNQDVNILHPVDEEDIEIEVGIEEKFPSPLTKPVKLFKPYLLDECDNKIKKVEQSDEQLEIISSGCFSNFISTTSTSSKDISTRENLFPDIVKGIINTSCVGSSNFLIESRSESPRSSCSPATSLSTMSPKNLMYPKGSPASSGYESSTSTYSDSSSLSSKHELYTYGQTYNINLQMQTIYNENTYALHPSKQVQRWLEKDDTKLLTSNSSIALLV